MQYFKIPLLILLLIVSCGTQEPEDSNPRAHEGVIDLQDWDIDQKPVVPLDGEWVFDAIQPDLGFQYLEVPSTWNAKIGGTGYGVASYKLKVLLNEKIRKTEEFSIGINDVSTAFEFYVNGELVHKKGKIGNNREEMKPSYKRPILLLGDRGDELDLELKISNYYHPKGGIRSSIFMGKYPSLYEMKKVQSAVMWILVGSTCIMGIYHFVIFLMRKVDKSSLWFGLFSIAVGCRALFDQTVFFYEILPDDYWVIIHKIDVLSFTFTLPLLTLFLYSLFREDFHRIVMKVFISIGLVFSLIVILARSDVYMVALNYFEIFAFFSIVYFIYIIIVTTKNKREGSFLFLIGCVFLFSTAINDILNQMRILYTGYYTNWGFLAFLFSQTTLLSRKFTRAFVHLEDLKSSLESKVIERTHQLSIAKSSAENANALKDKFLSLVSHDLRSPISSVIGLLNIVIDDFDEMSREEKIEFLSKAKNSSNHSLEMISQLLKMNRLKTGRMEIVKEEIGIFHEVETIVNKLWIQANQKKIRILNKIPMTMIIYTDKTLIGEIFFNLISNAIKFSHPDSSIQLTANPIGNDIEFHIIDSGVGIPENMIPKLFLSEEKTSTPGTMGEVGTGLGLPFVKDIIEALGGRIHVQSQEKEGSRFSFILENSYSENLPSDFIKETN